MVTKYQKRFSGPLLDRIDIHIEVPREAIRKRVQAACKIQLTRFANIESSNLVANVDMRVREIRQFCKLQDEGQSLMRAAMIQLNLLAHAYHRTLKLAYTIDHRFVIWRRSNRQCRPG